MKRTERASVCAPKTWSRLFVLKKVLQVLSKSRGLEYLSIETMHHFCRAEQMQEEVISMFELKIFLLWAKIFFC